MANPLYIKHSVNLFEYQEEAAEFLLQNPRGALWMMPGLGKTLSVIKALSESGCNRILIVAPKRCCVNVWPQELEKWCERPNYRVCLGTPMQRLTGMAGKHTVYIINYENIPWLINQDGGDWFRSMDAVVFDESSKLKSWQTKRFTILKKQIFYIPRVIEMTGTPAPNGLLGVWSQLYLLDKGERLGKFISHYKQRYFDQDYFGYTFTPKDPKRIHNQVEGLVWALRNPKYRDKILEVPILVDSKSPEYEEMRKHGVVEVYDIEVVAESAASVRNKMRQIANGFVYTEEHDTVRINKAKLEALKDLIGEMAGQPLMIFYEFQADKEQVLSELPEVVEFDDDQMDAWNRGEIPVMLLSPQSAGHGLNLQGGGNHICWITPPYDLELHEQANARLARMGQESETVVVHYLVGRGTVDEAVLQVLKDKDATQADLLKAVEQHRGNTDDR